MNSSCEMRERRSEGDVNVFMTHHVYKNYFARKKHQPSGTSYTSSMQEVSISDNGASRLFCCAAGKAQPHALSNLSAVSNFSHHGAFEKKENKKTHTYVCLMSEVLGVLHDS